VVSLVGMHPPRQISPARIITVAFACDALDGRPMWTRKMGGVYMFFGLESISRQCQSRSARQRSSKCSPSCRINIKCCRAPSICSLVWVTFYQKHLGTPAIMYSTGRYSYKKLSKCQCPNCHTYRTRPLPSRLADMLAFVSWHDLANSFAVLTSEEIFLLDISDAS